MCREILIMTPVYCVCCILFGCNIAFVTLFFLLYVVIWDIAQLPSGLYISYLSLITLYFRELSYSRRAAFTACIQCCVSFSVTLPSSNLLPSSTSLPSIRLSASLLILLTFPSISLSLPCVENSHIHHTPSYVIHNAFLSFCLVSVLVVILSYFSSSPTSVFLFYLPSLLETWLVALDG